MSGSNTTDQKFSQFPQAAAIDGTEFLVGLQNGANIRFPISSLQGASGQQGVPGTPGSLVTTLRLTSAQLLNLHAAPQQLIAAPGPGLVIVLKAVTYVFSGGTVAYSLTDGGPSLWFGLAGVNVVAADAFALSGMVVSTTPTVAMGAPSLIKTPTAISAVANQSVVFANPSFNMTLGNGTLIITAEYSLAPVV